MCLSPSLHVLVCAFRPLPVSEVEHHLVSPALSSVPVTERGLGIPPALHADLSSISSVRRSCPYLSSVKPFKRM
ncbi:hypothetical protein CEXT_783821 [Caerostris extrusa]|uniref:Secreted protein n=1 Tax=Caerostris extrusa TaxID=172846 RepID=A0AAV4Y992_CAEEX|nr:hypothetical protein CEXT_783821 [Caerostris extrusa]